MKPHMPISWLAPYSDREVITSLDQVFAGLKRGESKHFSVLGHGPYVGTRYRSAHEICALLQDQNGRSQYPIVFPNSVFLTGDVSLSKDKAGHCTMIIKPDDALPQLTYETEPFLFQGRIVSLTLRGADTATFIRKNKKWEFHSHSQTPQA